MRGTLKFCFIFWLIYGTEGQTAKCDYKYRNHWTKGYMPTNASYYTCDLNTRQASYGDKLSSIDGQHESGHTDADVKLISKNKDDKLKALSSIFCQKFPNLEVIRIINSELESIDEDSLSNCKNLNHLLLSGNKIRELPENLLIENSKLTLLEIYANQLTRLPENLFMNQKELNKLNFNSNLMNFLSGKIFHPLVKLAVLHLDNNIFESINPEWFVNLQNLQTLTLNENHISKIPSKCFASLRKLNILGLNGNSIKTLNSDSFDGLQNLQVLGLSRNDIFDLPVRVFTQLNNLHVLQLGDNKLTTIHSDSFGFHNRSILVSLQSNKINSIDPKFIDNTAVSTLNLKNNICSQLNTETRSEIKPTLKKCFDNYQPRLQSQLQANNCGKGLKAVNTIIGGTEVKRGTYPWIAGLIKSNDKYFCGGTLVSNRKVVTAAHCMVFLARDITVLLGVHDLSMRHETGRFPYAVQNIHKHPDWNPNTETNDADIAVMILETDVTFSRHIQPICLMDSSSILATRTEVVVVGYGKDEDPNKDHLNIPKSINMPIHQNEDCFLKNYELVQLSSKRTFCGGTGNGTGVCKGDSGSGLVVTDGTAYYLRGIVSASLYNMTYGCDVDTYSIFTNVLNFTDWINSVSIDLIFQN